MKKDTAFGRPTFKRNRVAGKNLRSALKVLGKTYRREITKPNHVRNWNIWTDCDLPSSATTIDKDMNEGIPEHRIAAYALCLGISPAALCSSKTNMVTMLKAPSTSPELPIPSMVLGYKDQFSERYLDHNRPAYIQKLFALMSGVYRMDYLLHGVDLIHRCTLWIHTAEAYRILIKGRFIMFGNENPFDATLFRWHNNLHYHYLCENGLELGYTMTVDPLRHNLVQRRKPFWLHGTGMTDRGLADNLPITFLFRKTKLSQPEGMTLEALWRQENAAMREHPFIAPGDPDYERVRTEILAPEILTSDILA